MTQEEKRDEKKIIIDEDWKQQAQREKETLIAQEKARKEKTQTQKARPAPLPEGNFAALISTLVTQALFAMGLIKVEGPQREPDLEMARYHIDMLETLEEKTKGNLTEEEQKILSDTLEQVRMAYVKIVG